MPIAGHLSGRGSKRAPCTVSEITLNIHSHSATCCTCSSRRPLTACV
jgi:hypothetical protein